MLKYGRTKQIPPDFFVVDVCRAQKYFNKHDQTSWLLPIITIITMRKERVQIVRSHVCVGMCTTSESITNFKIIRNRQSGYTQNIHVCVTSTWSEREMMSAISSFTLQRFIVFIIGITFILIQNKWTGKSNKWLHANYLFSFYLYIYTYKICISDMCAYLCKNFSSFNSGTEFYIRIHTNTNTTIHTCINKQQSAKHLDLFTLQTDVNHKFYHVFLCVVAYFPSYTCVSVCKRMKTNYLILQKHTTHDEQYTQSLVCCCFFLPHFCARRTKKILLYY